MITIVSVGPHYQLHVPLTNFSVLYSRLVIESAFVQRHCFPFTRIRNTLFLTSITKSCHVDFLLTLNMSLCLYVRVCALSRRILTGTYFLLSACYMWNQILLDIKTSFTKSSLANRTPCPINHALEYIYNVVDQNCS